jgi:hypothetical protein
MVTRICIILELWLGRSVRLLVVLASTVILGFESRRDPWPYFSFPSACFEVGPILPWEEESRVDSGEHSQTGPLFDSVSKRLPYIQKSFVTVSWKLWNYVILGYDSNELSSVNTLHMAPVSFKRIQQQNTGSFVVVYVCLMPLVTSTVDCTY